MISIECLCEQHAQLINSENAHTREGRLLDFQLRMAIMLMKHRGQQEVHAIGNFVKPGVQLPIAGQKIVIPKGAVFSTAVAGSGQTSYKSNRRVMVHRVNDGKGCGFFEEYQDSPAHIQELPIEITWSGKGGWCRISLQEWLANGGYELTAELHQEPDKSL
ncbi:MAG: hypothetical protein RSD49_17215 [Hafnia sp.]